MSTELAVAATAPKAAAAVTLTPALASAAVWPTLASWICRRLFDQLICLTSKFFDLYFFGPGNLCPAG